jgi:hypothetical protein
MFPSIPSRASGNLETFAEKQNYFPREQTLNVYYTNSAWFLTKYTQAASTGHKI